MYRLKRIGDMRLPYGVPALKKIFSFPILRVMLEKISLIISIVYDGMLIFSSFSKSLLWLTLLKADLKSIKLIKN